MKILIPLFFLCLSGTNAYTQSKEERLVQESVEKLNNALVSLDRNTLEEITAESLSYGHSTGHMKINQPSLMQL